MDTSTNLITHCLCLSDPTLGTLRHAESIPIPIVETVWQPSYQIPPPQMNRNMKDYTKVHKQVPTVV